MLDVPFSYSILQNVCIYNVYTQFDSGNFDVVDSTDPNRDKCGSGARISASRYNYGYQVKRQDVIYAIWDGSGRFEYILEGADSESFHVIKQYRYAKDRNAVYYHQTAICYPLYLRDSR